MERRVACLFILTLVATTSDQATKKKIYNIENDRIINLPGISQSTNFKMYSGYLDVSENKKIHYWLNTCTEEYCNKLLIWLNGGPGCSSLDGLLTEHGPFKFSPLNGELEENDYSWNKLAHTLYLESPVGVGFSYNSMNDPISDDSTAEDLLKAIRNFFEKFPQMNQYDVFLSGESYAGVYIPTLTNIMLDSGSSLTSKVKGIVIGNGLVHQNLNDQSLIYFAYYHGLFGSVLWEDLLRSCCKEGRPDRCEFYRFKDEMCMIQVAKVIQIVSNSGLNVYNLYQDCASSMQEYLALYFNEYFEKEILDKMKVVMEMKNFKLVPPCANATCITRYMNRADVQAAIHVKTTTWEICSDAVHEEYRKQYHDMSSNIKRIISEMDAEILLYFGDVDMACNYIGGEWFFDQFGYEVVTPRRSWMIPSSAGSEQIAGYVKGADKFTFATIKGAGHMVPTDRPRAAFFMMQRFLADEPI